jgi:hypothetical protein
LTCLRGWPIPVRFELCFVVLFFVWFTFFICFCPHSLGNSPIPRRVANGLSGSIARAHALTSPERLSAVVTSAVNAAVERVQARQLAVEDNDDGDMVDGADGDGGEALGVWTFKEDDKLRPVKCTVHVHVHDVDAIRARQDDKPDAADMLWLNDTQEELCVTVLFYLTPNLRARVCRKADGNTGKKMELGAQANAQ